MFLIIGIVGNYIANYVSNSTFNLLALRFFKGVGNTKLLKLASSSDFKYLNFSELIYKLNLKQDISKDREQALAFAEQQVNLSKLNDVKIISVLDQYYPFILHNCPHKPAILFVKGNLNVCSTAYAVIGSREPTTIGKEIAKRITEYCAKRNISIVSGLALGIDSVAHKTALNCNGHTIAVLGSGLDQIYPKENQILAEHIVEQGGALVSITLQTQAIVIL